MILQSPYLKTTIVVEFLRYYFVEHSGIVFSKTISLFKDRKRGNL